MTIDLHNHTKLCNHASGEMDQYIKKAVEKGVSFFGFSDHAPMDFDKKHRMSFDQMRQYEKNIQVAKEKYKNKVEILSAYEVDFLNGYMDERVLKAKVDYLIGSVHFLDEWGFDNPEFIKEYEGKDIDKIWQDYFDAIEKMAKSSLFDIVGHIDLIKIFKFMPKKEIQSIAKNALKEIKKANMVIEINTAGYRKPINEVYPGKEILQMMSEFNIPITFGSDAHDPSQVGFMLKKAKKTAKDFGYDKCAVFKNRERSMIAFL